MRKTFTLRLWLTLLVAVATTLCRAQMPMPVNFTVEQKQVSPTEVDVLFTAKIDKGWHVYSTDIPDGGPQSAVMHTEVAEGATPMGAMLKQGKEVNAEIEGRVTIKE